MFNASLFFFISGRYQIDLGGCLKGVKQVNHEGTFAQSEGISLCLQLVCHVFIHHIGFLHHL